MLKFMESEGTITFTFILYFILKTVYYKRSSSFIVVIALATMTLDWTHG